MSEDRNNKSENADYEVGYAKPPRHTQFKAGESGNPKGRPKKRATFKDIISQCVGELVTVNCAGKAKRVTALKAIGLRHTGKALAGDHRSTQLIVGALQAGERDPGNNLNEVLRQFRAIHDRHVANSSYPHRSTPVDKDEKDGHG